MAFVLYDNFLWRDDITITCSSEKNTAPLQNLMNPDPYIFWETEGTEEWIVLDLSATGAKKPFVVGFYNVNWTKDAFVYLESNDVNSGWGTPAAQDVHQVYGDIYHYSDTPRGFNKSVVGYAPILAASETDKNFIRLRIKDDGNAAGFLRAGIIFISSAISFSVADPYALDEGLVQGFKEESTKFYSLNKQMHTRIRKVGHTIKGSMSNAGGYSKIAIRRLIKEVGVHKPVFLSLNEKEDDITGEFSFSTQVYYGYFTKLPEIREHFYYEPSITGDIEKYMGADYSFEFMEIV